MGLLLLFAIPAGTTELKAQLITEFPVGGDPNSIASGPDGNLWFTEVNGNSIGRITPAGAVTHFPVGSGLSDITAGPDGNLWFARSGGSKIGRITPAGVITEFAVTSFPLGITAGPDGNIWFTGGNANKIGRITPAGDVTEFPTPANSFPSGITSGPDGNIWFTEGSARKIVRISTAGDVLNEYPVSGPPTSITAGSDGNLWILDGTGKIVRLTTAGVVTEFPIPTPNSEGIFALPRGITSGPDGNLWFIEFNVGKIGRITPSGIMTEFPTPSANSGPAGITAGPDGNIWFTEFNSKKVGRFSLAPRLQVSPATSMETSGPQGGPFAPASFQYQLSADTGSLDFAISGIPTWLNASFTSGTVTTSPLTVVFSVNADSLGPETYGGTITFTNTRSNQGTQSRTATLNVVTDTGKSTIVAAVAPNARTAIVGTAVTGFATIINSGDVGATGCSIALPAGVPANFLYQTTNPATNVPTGAPNTPVFIPTGQAQSFVFAITPTASFSTDIPLVFSCTNSDPAPVVTGLNTFLLTASNTAIPDMLSIAETFSHDGNIVINGSGGIGLMVTATFDIGAAGTVVFTPTSVPFGQSRSALPLSLAICQTNSQGQCINPNSPAASSTLAVAKDQTVFFSIFAFGQGTSIPYDPANNRVFMIATQGSTPVGEASAAVKMQ